MPTPTYTLIDSVTLGSSAATVTFSSIPAGGDAVLVISGTASAAASIKVKLNADATTTNYNWLLMYGNGSSAISSSFNDSYIGSINTSQGNSIIQLFDFSATDKHKSYLSRMNIDTQVRAGAGRWANTSAITSVELFTSAGTFDSGTTFHLYDIAKAL